MRRGGGPTGVFSNWLQKADISWIGATANQ